ncbi:hypothetical protein [Aliterella atlantica]|uniref:Uncharacterized protein n=1 Tax=Aliterella atlantica CENA595 TaxID=1618023 RepID=A0A0D8ZV14_9CYAN|nr:hypothetical protein [Aliterella atlantica]KJH72202.1 hypothetical protein UH38_09075 [Aliterella atlantica CENA595]
MALPEPFSDIEHLQLVVRRYLNKQIRADFKDIFGDGDTWEPEVGTTRGAMLRALLHEDSDPIAVTTVRMMLYYFTFGKARDLQTPVYGIPTTFYQQEALVHIPQITLHFKEDLEDVEPGYSPVVGEIAFRVSGETHETITETKLRVLAQRVKTNFGANNGFVWRKGKVKCNYSDRSKPYFLQILSRDVTQGKRVIEQVLDIQTDTPDWKYLNVRENQEASQAYPTIPPNKRILGSSRRLPRRRPIADVRFVKAECHIYGMPVPVILYDRTSINGKALVK